MELTKKEERLAELLAKTPGESLNIGYVCSTLRTTPRMLLSKTLPGLRAKLEAHATEQQLTAARKAANYGAST